MKDLAKDVLLVEDDETDFLSTREALENAGYSVDRLAFGEEAICKLRQSCYRILLIDYSLPDMTGLQLFRSVKAEIPHVVSIMITGSGNLPISTS